MKLFIRLFVILFVIAVIFAGMVFSAANDTAVPLDLGFYAFAPQSLAIWVLAAFAIGGVLGMLACSLILIRMRTSLSASKRQLTKTRNELAQLRDQNPAVETA